MGMVRPKQASIPAGLHVKNDPGSPRMKRPAFFPCRGAASLLFGCGQVDFAPAGPAAIQPGADGPVSARHEIASGRRGGGGRGGGSHPADSQALTAVCRRAPRRAAQPPSAQGARPAEIRHPGTLPSLLESNTRRSTSSCGAGLKLEARVSVRRQGALLQRQQLGGDPGQFFRPPLDFRQPALSQLTIWFNGAYNAAATRRLREGVGRHRLIETSLADADVGFGQPPRPTACVLTAGAGSTSPRPATPATTRPSCGDPSARGAPS